MSSLDDLDEDWLDVDEDELVDRLRSVRWPGAPDGLRERCWQGIAARVPDLEQRNLNGRGATMTRVSPKDALGRYDFSPRRPQGYPGRATPSILGRQSRFRSVSFAT